jgi:hypothetical protein
VPVDPTSFLSTVILASAALVAIVGGLLVARFVGLDSDQQTSRKLLADAEDRLAIATKRGALARQNLIRWRAQVFLDENDVAAALAVGETEIGELRKLASTRLSDDELRSIVGQAGADIASLRGWLSQDQVLDRIRAAEYTWRDFRRESDDMPTLYYPQLARLVFEDLAGRLAEDDAERERIEQERRAEAAKHQARHGGGPSGMDELGSGFRIAEHAAVLIKMHQLADNIRRPLDYSQLPSAMTIRPPNVAQIEASRYDDLIAADLRAHQRVEDLTEELRRLRQQHADVVRPDTRLWWAVVILAAYAIGGVAVPLWVMSEGPVSLRAVRWTFWPFAAGMVLLLGYIAVYLFGLTRRRRQWAGKAATASSLRATATPRKAAAWSDTLASSAAAGASSSVDPDVTGQAPPPTATVSPSDAPDLAVPDEE